MTAMQTPGTEPNPIKPRKMSFDMALLKEKYFFRNNSILSALMYSLSASFPDGERFFIDSVRHYQKGISNPTLQKQIRGFIGQEAHHARIHEDFNEQAESLGIPMARVTKRLKGRLDMAKRRFTPAQQLAVTSALEHVTATLAQWTLENPQMIEGDETSPLREMLIWHAMEEIEHKAVAFDVYREAVDDEKTRIAIAKIIFRTFWIQMAVSQITILWSQRTIPSIREIRDAWDFMWGKKGFRSWAAPEFKKYLHRGFHPNDIDQSELVTQWQDKYPEVAALQVV